MVDQTPQEGTPEFSPGALAGVRVLEFSQVVSASACGRILAELGADVIKIESPEGDPYRNSFNTIPDEGKRFQSLNVGKRGISIDLKSNRGREVVNRLLADADVLLTNFRHGVLDRLGFGYDQLAEQYPELIYCRITGFGTKTEHASKPASDPMMQAYSGLMAGAGKMDEDGLPVVATHTITDYTAAMASAIGILAALYWRRETGRGQLVDSGMLRGALTLQDTSVMREPVYDQVLRDPTANAVKEALEQGRPYREVIGIRSGVDRRGLPPASTLFGGPYQARDGIVLLGPLTPANRDAARRALGVTPDEEAWVNDAAAEEQAGRLAQLKQRVRERVAQRSVAEWVADLEREGCPAAPVNIPELMLDDPIVEAEGLIVNLEHEVTGPQRVAAPLVELSATPTRIQRPAPPLGRHTREVLEQAGLTPEEIDALKRERVVRIHPLADPEQAEGDRPGDAPK